MTTIKNDAWSRFAQEHGPDFATVEYISSLVTAPEAIAGTIGHSLMNATDPRVHEAIGLPRIRVFGPSQLDYEASEAVVHSKYDGSNLVEWLQAVTGRKDVCAAFNGVETWSSKIRSTIYRSIVEPMVTACGVPPRGLDFYSFIAVSGFTPFGIHSDPEPSFIFHLGPSTKTVWVWENDTLPKLPDNREISLHTDKYLKSADHEFTLSPGDFLCIPAGRFHLFRNNGPAVFLGMSYYREDNHDELLQAISTLVRRSENQQDLANTALVAASNGEIHRELDRRQSQRLSRGHLGPCRILPVELFNVDLPAECLDVPFAVNNNQISVMGQSISVPESISDEDISRFFQPGKVLRAVDLQKLTDNPSEGNALFIALLRVGATFQTTEAGS